MDEQAYTPLSKFHFTRQLATIKHLLLKASIHPIIQIPIYQTIGNNKTLDVNGQRTPHYPNSNLPDNWQQ